MSISGILSSCLYGNYANYSSTSSTQSKQDPFKQEFAQLGTDLQSGDLAAAQADLALIQSHAPSGTTSSSTSSTTSTKDALSQDFAQLSKDLQSGDTSDAQQDYAKIQQDFQSQGPQMHKHRHHNDSSSATSSSSTSDSSQTDIGQLMSQLGDALQSGDLSAATQAYKLLQLDFQQYGSSANTSSGSSTSVSALSLTA